MFFISIIFSYTFIISQVLCLTSNFNLIWFDANSTTKGNLLKIRDEVPDEAYHTRKIRIQQEIPILRDVDLFAVNLTILSMDNCSINDIELGAFANLVQQLHTLSLSMNRLRIVKEGVFNDLNVKYLNLSYNHITTIKAESFDNMPELVSVSLDHNEISNYALKFNNCPMLKRISLVNNFIEVLPRDAFDAIRSNGNLSVSLGYNKITNLSRETFNRTAFTILHLDHNELAILNDTFFDTEHIESFNLDGNHVECFPTAFLQNTLWKIKLFSAMDNPMNCTCVMDLINVAKKGTVRLNLTEECF